jgi:NADPH-dependent 2,4-dienoyl-CoA reductase/sulfur reductase-like enzyme
MTQHVIVGTGVAGISAAATLRQLDPGAEITLVGEDTHGFYSRPGLAYYLTDEIPEKQLYIYNKKDWQTLQLRYTRARVTRLDPAAKRIELGTAGALNYDRLLLATGSTAVRLSIPGADLQGVVKLDDFEDARRILALARRARHAVVIGGGVIAVELLEGLLQRGVEAHYFLRGDRYWPGVLEEKESRLIERRLVEHGARLHYHTEAAEILGRGGRVTGVRTQGGEQLRCDLVAVGIGVQPRTELAGSAGIRTERGILTDEYLRTSAADVFAAGDAAQVLDPSRGVALLDTLWHPARMQGIAAAYNMAGQLKAYLPGPAVNVLRLAGVMTTIVGAVARGRDDDLFNVARGSSETWRQLPNSIAMEVGSDVNLLRLMIGEETLLGAVVMGEQKLSLPLQELISARVGIASVRGKMLQAGDRLGDMVLDLWSRWKAEGGRYETQQ